MSLLNEDHRFLTFFVLEARLADANGFLALVGPFVKLLDFPLSFAVLSSLPLLPVCDSVSLCISAKNNGNNVNKQLLYINYLNIVAYLFPELLQDHSLPEKQKLDCL